MLKTQGKQYFIATYTWSLVLARSCCIRETMIVM
jgi:hypothetical protein